MKLHAIPLLPALLLLASCNDPTARGSDGDSGTSGTGAATDATAASTWTTTGAPGLDDTAGSTSVATTSEASTTGEPEPTLPRATVIMQTSGGGRVSSPAYAARIRIGAPQPVGSANTILHRVHLGPGSVQ